MPAITVGQPHQTKQATKTGPKSGSVVDVPVDVKQDNDTFKYSKSNTDCYFSQSRYLLTVIFQEYGTVYIYVESLNHSRVKCL